jgi:hypothetical protein
MNHDQKILSAFLAKYSSHTIASALLQIQGLLLIIKKHNGSAS